ncbi:protein NO VEIN domain-containing protein [Thiomicrolovo sp. ZZH C-3]
MEDLQAYCLKSSLQLGESFYGILDLLFAMKIASKSEDDVLSIENMLDCTKVDVFTRQFLQMLFQMLDAADMLSTLFTRDSLTYDRELKTYVVKESRIPFKLYNFKNFFLESNLFQRHELINGLLIINADYLDVFHDSVIAIVNSSKKIKKTIEQLKQDLEQKQVYGEEAEEFVLAFELKRLYAHPQKDKIEQVSKEDVSAGYDIQSFHMDTSVLINRFIEVKSFDTLVKFYWSKNEVDTARVLRKDYFLYLVDRSQMLEEGYEPLMIQDPFFNVFENDEGWKKEAHSWMLSCQPCNKYTTDHTNG